MSFIRRSDATTALDAATVPPDLLHQRLAAFNRRRLTPTLAGSDWQVDLMDEIQHRMLEGSIIAIERAEVAERAAAAPADPDAFVAWFENLRDTGPGQGDPLFPWLAVRAGLEEMRWFLLQEVAGEAGFEDLVALTQVKFPVRAKLELARNYWDEMGRGNERGMHGPMLSRLAEALGLESTIEGTVWESLALANIMVALATSRQLAYHSIGALGVIELTAPGRAALVTQGLRRLGVDAKARHYFELHAVLDVKHSECWNREVLHPLVAADPAAAPAIAEGALMRLTCGARCFRRYRRHFGLH